VVIKLGFCESGKRERGQNHQDADRMKSTECGASGSSVLEIIHDFNDQFLGTRHLKETSYYIR